MILNPILKVLSVMHGCRVRFLLMGGQACVVYGGSEFSRELTSQRKLLELLPGCTDDILAEALNNEE